MIITARDPGLHAINHDDEKPTNVSDGSVLSVCAEGLLDHTHSSHRTYTLPKPTKIVGMGKLVQIAGSERCDGLFQNPS